MFSQYVSDVANEQGWSHLTLDGALIEIDRGYTHPVTACDLDVANRSYNMLLTAMRAIGDRASAELDEHWRCLR